MSITIATTTATDAGERGREFGEAWASEIRATWHQYERLFAAAWSACYISAVGLAAKAHKLTLPSGLAVEIEVDLGQTGREYLLQARLNVRMPGVPHDVASAVAHAADEICPYSKATRGNIDVAINVITG